MTAVLDSALGSDDTERVARALPLQAARLSRLFLRHARTSLSRTEAGVLATLSAAPRTISELAELEGLAQPTTTLMVKRLEECGCVTRERRSADARVVVVSVTDAGRSMLEEVRGQYRAVLRRRMVEMSDEQVRALVAATEALVPLIEALQRGERA